jgi:hypothetical protein
MTDPIAWRNVEVARDREGGFLAVANDVVREIVCDAKPNSDIRSLIQVDSCLRKRKLGRHGFAAPRLAALTACNVMTTNVGKFDST